MFYSFIYYTLSFQVRKHEENVAAVQDEIRKLMNTTGICPDAMAWKRLRESTPVQNQERSFKEQKLNVTTPDNYSQTHNFFN